MPSEDKAVRQIEEHVAAFVFSQKLQSALSQVDGGDAGTAALTSLVNSLGAWLKGNNLAVMRDTRSLRSSSQLRGTDKTALAAVGFARKEKKNSCCTSAAHASRHHAQQNAKLNEELQAARASVA